MAFPLNPLLKIRSKESVCPLRCIASPYSQYSAPHHQHSHRSRRPFMKKFNLKHLLLVFIRLSCLTDSHSCLQLQLQSQYHSRRPPHSHSYKPKLKAVTRVQLTKQGISTTSRNSPATTSSVCLRQWIYISTLTAS